MNNEMFQLVKAYILEIINKKHIALSDEQIIEETQKYINSGLSFEEIKQSIDKRIESSQKDIANIDLLIQQIMPNTKNDCFFGEVYKSYIIHIFKLYENIANSEYSQEEKKKTFEIELSKYLKSNYAEMMNYLKSQTSSARLNSLATEELQRGADSLNYEVVGQLYNTFVNDVTLVSNDFEGRMYSTVLNNRPIFVMENGNLRINPEIKFNFGMLKEIYDFALKHDKKIKFHTFLWHNSVPDNLKKEVDSIPDPAIKRKMVLSFLDSYASALKEFFKNNNYDLRQFEALNEIANNKIEGKLLRDSWWREVIGNNPENGDPYFIDVLKIVKKHFPDIEVIYNEFNEYVDYKADRIVEIIKIIRDVEARDGVTLLDGIGLQAHYADYIPELDRPLSIYDIINTAVKLQDACGDKHIYITEYDFLDLCKNGQKDILEDAFVNIYSKIANGFIMWGNSDSLTWHHCIDKSGHSRNATLFDDKGIPKRVFFQVRESFKEKIM